MAAPQIVVGVDPGGASTGIVTISGRDVIWSRVVERRSFESEGLYLGEIGDDIAILLDQARRLTARLILAVEGLNSPTPQMGLTSVRGLIDTAVVLGYVQAIASASGAFVIVVPPGRHGSHPLAAYPPALVGDRERSGSGRLRHARSAYDVALTGCTLARIGDATT